MTSLPSGEEKLSPSRKALHHTRLHRQLEIEFTVQSYHLAFHIAEHEHQPIKPSDHWNAHVFHTSHVLNRWIVNDHRGEQVVVLVGRGNLQVR